MIEKTTERMEDHYPKNQIQSLLLTRIIDVDFNLLFVAQKFTIKNNFMWLEVLDVNYTLIMLRYLIIH